MILAEIFTTDISETTYPEGILLVFAPSCMEQAMAKKITTETTK